MKIPLRKKSFILSFCVLLVAVFLSGRAAGQDISGFDERLFRIRRQIEEVKGRIVEEEQKEETILSSLERVVLHKSLIKTELSLYNVQMEKTSAELAGLRRRIPVLRDKLEREKRSMEKTLETLYKYGRLDFFQFYFQTKDITNLVAEHKNLTILADYQESVLRSYRATLAELAETENSLLAKTDELGRLIEGAKAKRRELEGEERQHKRLIDQIHRNKASYEQTLRELEDRARELARLMEKLQRQEIILPTPFIPLYERKGRLPWPIEGRVVTAFGVEKHPQFNTSTRNNGIDIAPLKKDAVVKAVHAGKVVYADYFQGYGNLLILDHGLSYYSLYGHCSSFLAAIGDLVEAEQPLAVAGDIGSLKGVTLYLEIRNKAKPLDPLKWLWPR
ncbi:MAG TPA: peptidoglycan DD-metalloendopeptidase family protein [Acidobacteriota bacterium]